MSSPAISVMVPARNAGNLLQQCTDSNRRQSFADFELILVDSIVCALATSTGCVSR